MDIKNGYIYFFGVVFFVFQVPSGGFTFAVPGRGTAALVFIAALAHNYTSDITWHNGSKQQHHVFFSLTS